MIPEGSISGFVFRGTGIEVRTGKEEPEPVKINQSRNTDISTSIN